MTSAYLCSHCQKSISGRYFKDYWGNIYHAVHMKNVPSCNYCGRLISKDLTQGGKTYSDGRKICGLCRRSAVDDLTEGKMILKEVHDTMALNGIEIFPFKPEFFLIDRSSLKYVSGNSEKQGYARIQRETINGSIKNFTLQIYILKGLPESSFITAAAHELMHIWFYSRNITEAQPRLVEGSCNYAAYLQLQTMKSPEAYYRIHELMEDKSPVYGRGFQKIYKMVQSKGIGYWLRYIQTLKR